MCVVKVQHLVLRLGIVTLKVFVQRQNFTDTASKLFTQKPGCAMAGVVSH